MRRLAAAAAAVLAALALLYLAIESMGVPLLSDPSPWMSAGGAGAAALGFALLVGDVFLPVPSSFLMVAHGALFGVALGALLSLAGSVGAALVGFAIGRAGGPLLMRLVEPEERARAESLLRRWGVVAVALSRPVPLVAETVAIIAGASSLRWGPVAAAALIGSLPPALLYAMTGAHAAGFGQAALVFVLVLVLTGVLWWIGRGLGGGTSTDGAA